MSETIGTLETIYEIKVEWRIVDFFSLGKAVDAKYSSARFTFMGESWYLNIYPNDGNSTNQNGIGLFLNRDSGSGPMSVSFLLSLKTANGEIHRNRYHNQVFEACEERGCNQYMKRLELVEKKATLVPSDVLTIVCCIRKNEQIPAFRTEELSRDVGSLMKDETDADVVFQVGQEEFKLHRGILRARSPVLAAMFTHYMTEKTTGVVSIQDCEADVFRTFTEYLYTGIVDELSADRVFQLFKLADKYQVKELADDCMRHMANTLSVDTFIDAVIVASEYGNKFLMKKATLLFSDKIAKIIRTAEWESLLEKNPVLANKLLKKAINE